MIKFQPYKIPEQVEKTEEELTKEEYEGVFKHFLFWYHHHYTYELIIKKIRGFYENELV